jgi:ribosomal-protein-alanine N-acetyltransferase
LRLITERLLLRPAERKDAEDLHAVFSDPSTFDYIGADPARSIEETIDRIEHKARLQAEQGFSLWSVVERTRGRVIGDCGLRMLDGGPEVELGYRLGREFRGRGYATEAARACLAAGFEQLGLDRIVAVAWPDHTASRRVMEKAGMTLAGMGFHYGHETVLYEITREAAAARAG